MHIFRSFVLFSEGECVPIISNRLTASNTSKVTVTPEGTVENLEWLH